VVAPQENGFRLIEKIGKAFACHEEVLICEDCNTADTRAKALVNAPKNFTFSVEQILTFISPIPHEIPEIKADVLKTVWQEAESVYNLRIKIMRDIARAAATNLHWYYPFPRNQNAIPTLISKSREGDRAIAQWVSYNEILQKLLPSAKVSKPDRTKWRKKAFVASLALPDKFLQILLSDSAAATRYNSLPAHWFCPICDRTKLETVYFSEKKKITFIYKEPSSTGQWKHVNEICNHCFTVLNCLKLEIADEISLEEMSLYDLASPKELKAIIVANPHSAHSVNRIEAEKLLVCAIERIKNAG